MRRRVEADAQALRAQLGGEEGARRALTVGTADVDSREAALRVVECGEEPLGGSEAPFDAAGLSGEEEAAGVREGQPRPRRSHAVAAFPEDTPPDCAPRVPRPAASLATPS